MSLNKQKRNNKNIKKSALISVIVLGAIIAAAVLTIARSGSLSESITALSGTNVAYLVAATIAFIVHFFSAAATYRLLAFRGLRYFPTVLIAVSGAFAGKLLPAGAGGITLYFLYLRRSRYTSAQAASLVATNNVLGIFAHSSLVLIASLLGFTALASVSLRPAQLASGAVFVALLLVAATIIMRRPRAKAVRKRIQRELANMVGTYRSQPWRLVGAFITSATVTLSYTACLYFCALAVGADISYITALAVFTVGAAATGLAPTPGGLGAIEAGLVAALVSFSVATPTALAVVLVYRLVSFWIPFAIGAMALFTARRLRYI